MPTRRTRRAPPHHARRRLAYHEAGHAVVARYLGVELTEVTIERRGRYLGRVEALVPDPARHARRRPRLGDAVRQAAICLAGSVAEKRVHEWVEWRGSSDDRTMALAVLEAATGSLPQTTALMEYAWAVTRDFLHDERAWAAVERVAAALLERGTLRLRELKRLIPRRYAGLPVPAWR